MANVEVQKYTMSKGTKIASALCILLGAVIFFVGLLKGDVSRIWHAYLVGYFYFVSLALGGLFWVALQNATKAGWSVAFRRIPESFTAFLPAAVLLTIPLILGAGHLFEWLHPDIVAKDAILEAKSAYLNKGFFNIRLVIYYAIWLFFGWKIVSNSLQQDKDGNEKHTISSLKYSVAFLILFALSYSLFSVDLLMSLDPHWFSTMFGIYAFAGLFQSFLAMTAIYMISLIRNGFYKNAVTTEHVHDIAKYMWAFTIFYAYIAFSQFMLIWYANLPEETFFFLDRAHGNWFYISMALLIFKFIVPFLALAPRAAKRNFTHVKNVAILILAVQYMDFYWLIYPNLNKEAPVFGIWEIGIWIGFLGVFMYASFSFLEKKILSYR